MYLELTQTSMICVGFVLSD